MKYTCNVCGYNGEGDGQYCSMCGSTNIRIDGQKQTDIRQVQDDTVYSCTVVREYTKNSMLVQFTNKTWGILDLKGDTIPNTVNPGSDIEVKVVYYDSQGYPHLCMNKKIEVVTTDNRNKEPEIMDYQIVREETQSNKEENSDAHVVQDNQEKKEERVRRYVADYSSYDEGDIEVDSEAVIKNDMSEVDSDVAEKLFDSERKNVIHNGDSWDHWHEMEIGHQAATKAVYSLEKFVNTYLSEMYKERDHVSACKERLRRGYESQKKNINEEYEKIILASNNSSDARINGNKIKMLSIENIEAIGQSFVDAIPTALSFDKARKVAVEKQHEVYAAGAAAKGTLQKQLQLLIELARIDNIIITEKFNEKMSDAKHEYDRNSVDMDRKFENFVSTLKTQCSEDIARGFSKSDIESYSRMVGSSRLNENNYESPKCLPEYINLGSVCIDIDTSVDKDHLSIAHIVEQQTQDIIKKDGNIFTIELPYCQRLIDGISLFVSYDEQDRMLMRDKIQPLLLKMFMYFPAGFLEATMIDPLEMGTSFHGISKLAGISHERVIDTKIWSKESDIEQAIATLRLRMETLTQSYNGNRISRFQKEPVKILAITDFPVGFTNNALKDLQAIVRNAALLGVCVLIWANNKELVKFRERNESLYQEIASNLVVTHAEHEKLRFENTGVYIKLDPMSDIVSNNDQIIDIIKKNIEHGTTKVERFEDMMGYDVEDSNNWFTGNAHEISVPIGIMGADTVVSMVLGRGGGSTEHHVLIAGLTGSGKTTLMHTLIMSTLLQYSPEDVQMYLVDFKEGVAFKPYTRYRLPSLRVVAIDSEREFGLSILNELCNELEVRADIFSREEVEDINDYNNISGVKKVPKIMLIFDEVQELFRSRGNEDSITKDCLSAIGKLVTQGRALGIHLILACQDFAHCQGLQTYFSQMAVRIAIKGAEEGVSSILSSDNAGVKTLQKQPTGSAIYNRSGGVESANTFFQIAYLDKEERLNLLQIMNNYYTDSVIAEKYKDCNTRVMLTNAEDNINNKFNQLIRYGYHEDFTKIGNSDTAYGLQLGQGFGKNIDFTVNLDKARGNNLLIVGKDEKKALSIFEFSAMSLLYDELFTDNDASNTLLYIADMSDMSGLNLQNDTCDFDYLQEILPDQVTVVKVNQFEKLIDTLYRNVKARKQSGAFDEERIFVMLFGINRVKSLTRSRMYDDEMQTISTVDKINDIFKYGPEVGVNSIVWGENLTAIRRNVGDRVDGFFNLRIAFGLPEEDMYNLVSEEDVASVNEATVVYMNIVNDIKNKHFRPYTVPAKVWLGDFADVYIETIEAYGGLKI